MASEDDVQVMVRRQVDHRRGRITTGFGELHFPENTFASQGSSATLSRKVQDERGMEIELAGVRDHDTVVTVYLRAVPNAGTKMKGTNSTQADGEVEVIDSAEWVSRRMPISEFCSKMMSTADTYGGFVVLSN